MICNHPGLLFFVDSHLSQRTRILRKQRYGKNVSKLLLVSLKMNLARRCVLQPLSVPSRLFAASYCDFDVLLLLF